MVGGKIPWLILGSFAASAAFITTGTSAQPVQTQAEALADDATQYAALSVCTPDEAIRRLKAQQASVAATDAIAVEFAGRLAGFQSSIRPNIGSSSS